MLAIRKMGPIGNLLGMLPGTGQMKDALAEVDDSAPRPDRGDHPRHDAGRAAEPEDHQRAPAGCASPTAPASTVREVNQLVDRFFEARKMMSQMAGQMGMPFGRKGVSRKAAKGKGKKGKKGGAGTDAAEGAQPAAAPACRRGLPRPVRTCRKGLDELPPGLADFDLSKLKFPGKK